MDAPYKIRKILPAEYLSWAKPQLVARSPWFVFCLKRHQVHAFSSWDEAFSYATKQAMKGGK
jgi:hypothetical protein